MVHYDLGLEADGAVVALDKAPQLPLGFSGVELRLVLNGLGELGGVPKSRGIQATHR